ncbi:unnamed protein product [Agarophyton chilense]
MDGSDKCRLSEFRLVQYDESEDDGDEELGLEAATCAHYIYITQGRHNNLAHDDLADAVARGFVKTVAGCIVWGWRGTSRALRNYAKTWLQKRENVSMEHLLNEFSVDVYPLLKYELIAIAMMDTRVADMIEGNKSFTLNAGFVHGFVENSEVMTVGPWLKGRILKDPDGIWWHTNLREPILVSTENDISTVCKANTHSMRPSNELGRWIA